MVEELLVDDGAEIYMRPAKDYVATGQPVNLCSVVKSVNDKGEIFVGYMDRATEEIKRL